MEMQGWWTHTLALALACLACDDPRTRGPADAAPTPDGGPTAITPDDWPAALGSAEPGDILPLSVGTFVGGVRIPPGVTVQGADSRNTCIVGEPGAVVVELSTDSTLRDLCVEGGAVGVRAEAVARIDLERVEVRDADVVGVHLERVDMAELIDVSIHAIGGPEAGDDAPPEGAGHLIVRASAVGVLRGAIGPGAVPGISVDWPGDAPPADCEGSWAGCPFSGLLGMRDVQVEETAGAALTARHAAIRIMSGRLIAGMPHRNLLRGRGIAATLSALMIDGGTIIDCGGQALPNRQGFACDSCRTYVDGLTVQECGLGGVLLNRATSAEVRAAPFPSVDSHTFPAFAAWPPSDIWQVDVAALTLERFPDMDWYPVEDFIGPPGADEALPQSLQLGGGVGVEAAELHLHRWARGEWRDVMVRDVRVWGIRLSGHAVRLIRPDVSGLSLAEGVDPIAPDANNVPTAIHIGESGMVSAVEVSGGSTAAFSQIVAPRLVGNQGRGLLVDRSFVTVRTPVAGGAVDQVLLEGVRLSMGDPGDVQISENAWGGIAIMNSVATIEASNLVNNGGYGVLIRGSAVDLTESTIEGTVFASYGSDQGVVQTGHGVVIDATSSFFSGFDARLITIDGVRIRGAQQAGLLFRSLPDAPLEGQVIVDDISDVEVPAGYQGLNPADTELDYQGPMLRAVDYPLPP